MGGRAVGRAVGRQKGRVLASFELAEGRLQKLVVTTLVTEILKIVVNVITVYQSPGNDNVSRSDDDSEGEIYY